MRDASEANTTNGRAIFKRMVKDVVTQLVTVSLLCASQYWFVVILTKGPVSFSIWAMLMVATYTVPMSVLTIRVHYLKMRAGEDPNCWPDFSRPGARFLFKWWIMFSLAAFPNGYLAMYGTATLCSDKINWGAVILTCVFFLCTLLVMVVLLKRLWDRLYALESHSSNRSS